MENIDPKMLYEQKREEKMKMREGEGAGTSVTKKAVWVLIALGGVAAIGWWIYSLAPQGPDFSMAYPELGREHIPDGDPRPAYNSNPPTSGPHYADPAAEDFYDKEIPDEYLVHNLEHGDVWIAYHPRVSSEVTDALKKYVGPKVIATSRAANEFDVSLVSWGRLDGFNIENGVLDEVRIKDFIKRYKNRGPEYVPQGMTGKTF
jgi:hypothetical protein